MTSSFPTSGWAVIGALLGALGLVLAWAGKRIAAQDKAYQALTEKVISDVVPAVTTSNATMASALDVLQKALQLLAASEAVHESRRPR